jgi:hypothetical protein
VNSAVINMDVQVIDLYSFGYMDIWEIMSSKPAWVTKKGNTETVACWLLLRYNVTS